MSDQATERPYHSLSVIPDIDQHILAGIAAGKSLAKIAREYDVDDMAILRRVQKHPDWKDIQRIGLELRAGQREEQLESAPDNVGVTRADRLLAHTRWLLERCVPEVYGQKAHVTGDFNVQVTIARGVTLDQDVQDVVAEASMQAQQTGP